MQRGQLAPMTAVLTAAFLPPTKPLDKEKKPSRTMKEALARLDEEASLLREVAKGVKK
jgi:hypothetical protein